MGQIFEIIFLAIISLYLLYRLWSILGQENDEDRQRRQNKATQIIENEEDNIIQLASRPSSYELPDIESNLKPGAKAGLATLQAADPSFDFNRFIRGAKNAYAMIIKAFADKDKETLKQLLTRKVYAQFEDVIDSWQENKISIGTELESIQRVDVDSIEVNNAQAAIAVRFKSTQVRITLDESGTIIDNPAKISTSITDIWTFTRRIDSDDPNWYLAATRTETTSY